MNDKKPQPGSDSIRRRFTRAHVLVISGIMILFSATVISYNLRSLEKELERRLDHLTQIAVRGLASALWQYNDEYVNEYVDSLFSDEDLAFAGVFADGKTVRIRSRKGLEGRDFRYFVESSHFVTREATVRYEDIVIGRLALSLSRDRVERQTAVNSAAAITLLFLVILSVALTNVILSRKYLFRPLGRLETAVRSIAEGKFDTRMDTRSRDEIGELTRTFDHMVAKLRATTASRDELEAEIRERQRVEEENRLLEAQLRQATKMEAIGTLAGGIGHEFNNILGIVLGFSELALDDIPDRHPVRNHLNEIRTASIRGRDVVRQLLSFSRKSTSEKRPVDLGGVVGESIQFLRASLPASILFKTDIPEYRLPILADRTQIHQLLINLCNNAAQAMEQRGGVLSIGLESVTVSERELFAGQTLEPGPYVCLVVCDTGHGIAEDAIERVFDPFYSTKQIDKGTGLGLSVVYGIVKDHRGFIRITSTLLQGTTVRCYFPDNVTAAAEDIDDPQPVPTGAQNILFVDDEPSLARIFGEHLQRLGYRVETQTDPRRALESFTAEPQKTDLVVTDLTMPHLTGDELVRALHRVRPSIKTIICTGYSDRIDGESAVRCGADAFVMKPIDRKELALIVRNVLDGKAPLAPSRPEKPLDDAWDAACPNSVPEKEPQHKDSAP